mgnify:CR=1 FL=1
MRDYSKVKGNLLFQQAAVSCSLPFTFMFLLVIFSCFAISAVVSSLPFLQVMICIVFSLGNDFLLSSF